MLGRNIRLGVACGREFGGKLSYIADIQEFLKNLERVASESRVFIDLMKDMTPKVSQSEMIITEMGPRDGLQAIKTQLDHNIKAAYINKLVNSGIRRIEVGSFVSPKIEQMANTGSVLNMLQKTQFNGHQVDYIVLVPSAMYAAKAFEQDKNKILTEFAGFTSISEKFSEKNNNCSSVIGLKRVSEIAEYAAYETDISKLSVHISCVFGCPYEGYNEHETNTKLLRMVDKLLGYGVNEIKLADTIGTATPSRVINTIDNLTRHFGINILDKIGVHLHDPHNLAVHNVMAAIGMGIRRFDSSTGNIGGCNNVPNPSKNVSSVMLAELAEICGMETGIDIERLKKTASFIERKIINK